MKAVTHHKDQISKKKSWDEVSKASLEYLPNLSVSVNLMQPSLGKSVNFSDRVLSIISMNEYRYKHIPLDFLFPSESVSTHIHMIPPQAVQHSTAHCASRPVCVLLLSTDVLSRPSARQHNLRPFETRAGSPSWPETGF